MNSLLVTLISGNSVLFHSLKLSESPKFSRTPKFYKIKRVGLQGWVTESKVNEGLIYRLEPHSLKVFNS